jgi:hypothetical protein
VIPSFIVTVDRPRGLALVKSTTRGEAKTMLDRLRVDYGWSPSKRGWFTGAEHVSDIEAYARSGGGYAVVHGRDDVADQAELAAATAVVREAGMLS